MIHEILIDILLLLAVTVLVVGLFRQLRIPAIIGYLTVGVLIGPNGLSWLTDATEIRVMAELGVVFLLFMVGLEFSLPVLAASRAAIFGFGGAQVLLTGGLATALALSAGLFLPAAIVLGGALAMSSTAIVLRQLTEQGELATRHGRLAVSVLLFQDLAVLPFLVAIPVLAAGGGDMIPALMLALTKAALVFAAMLVAGRLLISPAIHWVARANSPEFFVLATLLLILAAAAAADIAGLSHAIGAFLAGMIVGETPFKHYVEDEIRPFRDVLLGLFFVTIGMQLDLPAVAASAAPVALLVLAIVVGKPLLILALTPLGNTHPGVVFRTGICLGHVGEFGLLILSLALGHGLIGSALGQPLLAAMVVSMMLAPLAIRWNGVGVKRWNFLGYRKNLERQEVRAARISEELAEHVVVCGYGNYGRHLVRFLELEGVPYIALDTDADNVRRARIAHKRVLYGYAGRFTLLEAVGIRRARALAITFDEPDLAFRIIRQVRAQLPQLPILVRAADVSDLDILEAAGASDVLPEALEASIQLAAQLLLILGIPHSRVEEHMDTVRGDQYRLLRGCLAHAGPDGTHECPETLRAVRITDGSRAVGRTLKDIDPESHGITVVALRRAGIRVPELGMDTAFRPRDMLVLAGPPAALEAFERYLQARMGPAQIPGAGRDNGAEPE
ncbi:MAG: cation:proton antiporter [Gammaproteobacteria bacterium]|jgi:CPA2 family monovalent cation:H+ antiporter-2